MLALTAGIAASNNAFAEPVKEDQQQTDKDENPTDGAAVDELMSITAGIQEWAEKRPGALMELLEPETWRRLPTPTLPGTVREMMEAPQRTVAALLDTEAGKFGARKAVQLGKAFPILGFGMRQLGEVGTSVTR